MSIDRKAVIDCFVEETGEALVEIEQVFLSIESQEFAPGSIDAVFRQVHTIKGNAASLGFAGLASFTHALEDSLEALRAGANERHAAVLLSAVDVLRNAIRAIAAGTEPALPTELQSQLKALKTNPSEAAQQSARNTSNLPEHSQSQTLRVSIETLDKIMNLVGEIGIAQGKMRQRLETVDLAVREQLLESLHDADRRTMELQEQVMELRMVPIGPTFHRYERLVRDLAKAQGKKVKLVIEGEDAGIDSAVIDKIRDPLTHIIRNAVDHGIESPEKRLTAAKPETGTIRLNAFREAGSIVVEVNDDGAGLSREKIAARARTLGLNAEADRLSTQEITRLIFEQGFSTAEKVSEISGRGVGMDVVRRNIEALHGRVQVESVEGQGTTITLRLPLTLAIIEGLLVGVGSERFVVPLDSLVECVELPQEFVAGNNGQGVMSLRGQPLPFVRLRNVFAVEGTVSRENVAVVRHGGMLAGIVVDTLHGESQAVIKPLGKLFQNIRAISGSTMLGDGTIALVLDVQGLVRMGVDSSAVPVAN